MVSFPVEKCFTGYLTMKLCFSSIYFPGLLPDYLY